MLKRLMSLAAALVFSTTAVNISAIAEENTSSRTVRLAVISDLHYVPTPSEADTKNVEQAGLNEMRMTVENERILDQAMKDIIASKPDNILISGDITSNSERIDPEDFRTIFNDFGCGENSRFFGGKTDSSVGNSGELSYATEICDGVTLIVLDGGTYGNDKTKQFSEAQQIPRKDIAGAA